LFCIFISLIGIAQTKKTASAKCRSGSGGRIFDKKKPLSAHGRSGSIVFGREGQFMVRPFYRPPKTKKTRQHRANGVNWTEIKKAESGIPYSTRKISNINK
jgi:hypothetical protein